jgi:hypothetical protein
MGFALAQVIEVESLSNMTRFTKVDKSNAEAAWRQQMFANLMDESADVQKDALRRLECAALELAFSADGGSILEKAIEVAHRHTQEETFASELHGHVRALAWSSSGVDVLTKCLETFDAATTHFIVEELAGLAVAMALSEDGYTVICQILEYQPSEQVGALVAELRMGEETLRSDVWGNIVLDILDDIE